MKIKISKFKLLCYSLLLIVLGHDKFSKIFLIFFSKKGGMDLNYRFYCYIHLAKMLGGLNFKILMLKILAISWIMIICNSLTLERLRSNFTYHLYKPLIFLSFDLPCKYRQCFYLSLSHC